MLCHFQIMPVESLRHRKPVVLSGASGGKTIEAGIILTEIEARLGKLQRILVVCPSMLMPKWKTEIGKRFDQDFDIVGQTEVR